VYIAHNKTQFSLLQHWFTEKGILGWTSTR